MQELAKRSSGGTSGYVRIIVSLASAVILTFFASQIYSAHDMKLPVKIGVILVIAAIGFGGIHSILTPEPDEASVLPEHEIVELRYRDVRRSSQRCNRAAWLRPHRIRASSAGMRGPTSPAWTARTITSAVSKPPTKPERPRPVIAARR